MNLRIPGPTPLPMAVREATAADMINHRGPEFKELFGGICTGLQSILGTSGDVLILTGSGTGGLEAAIVNLLNPGDKVIALSIGAFGDRFADIARAFGAQVTLLSTPWGQAADPLVLEAALNETPDARLVLVTHNETSTGVTNDVKTLAEVVRAHKKDSGHPLLVVDSISGGGALPLEMDAWGCDVVVLGSQKAWMTPPGITMVAVGKQAWPVVEKATCPRFYWDFRQAKSWADKGQTPWTPAVGVLFGMQAALKMMLAEGMENIYARHRRVGQHMRDGAVRLGLELFADPAHAANTVTAIKVPAGWDDATITKGMRARGVVISGGQGKLKGQVIRVGHLGYVDVPDIDEVLAALAAVLGRG
jgi:aspartate aminotransferase-like enzyme